MSYCTQFDRTCKGLPWLSHLGTCAQCRAEAWRNHERPNIYLGTVPGGFNDSDGHSFHRNFDKGMYEYEKARKEGLQPKATTVEAVREAQDQVRVHKKALKKLNKVADVEGINVAPGVET